MSNENQIEDQVIEDQVDGQEQPKKKRRVFSRRNFLIGGGIVLGGAVAGIYFGRTPLRRQLAQIIAEAESPLGIRNFEADFLFEIQEDNTLLINAPKAEMGQGIFTGIAMPGVEELDLPLEQVTVVPASTAGGFIDNFGTGGSGTTLAFYTPMREVAATFREMLKMAAAKKWGADTVEVNTAAGYMTAGSERMSYFDIVNSTR